MKDNFYLNFKDAQEYGIHQLLQKSLDQDQFEEGYDNFTQLLQKIEVLQKNQSFDQFLDFVWSEDTKKKKMIKFDIEIKQMAFFYSFQNIEQSFTQMWIALMMQHSQENPLIQRVMDDLQQIKGQEDVGEKDFYNENFEDLINKLIENLDISHRKFSLNIIFFLYHTKLESVDDFINYYTQNIYDIYFNKQFQILELEEISTDEEN